MAKQALIRLFLASIITALFLSFSACSKKGLGLKIGDQDILALGQIESCNFVQNSQSLRVSWKSSTPMTLLITSDVPTEFDDTIKAAAEVWNNSLNKELIRVHRDNNAEAVSANDGKNLIVWFKDWADDASQEQARTAIRWEISKLRDADIRVNAKHYQFSSKDDPPTIGKIDLLSLMVHEMGHAIGLKHITQNGSVMQVYLTSGVRRTSIGETETNSLKCEY